MAIKKYTNGSWVSASYRKYGTETDAITTLPATVIGDSTPISSYTIKGNMEQSGSPTPSSPIYPSECGERTENLFDVQDFTYTGEQAQLRILLWGGTLPEGTYTVSVMQESELTSSVRNTLIVNVNGATRYESSLENYHNNVGLHTMTFDVNDGDAVSISYWSHTLSNPCTYSNAMLNLGSTPLPYEPYGYKLPLTLGGTTTNIYLGEVQSTRRIKKLVLTGAESWLKSTSRQGSMYFSISDNIVGGQSICDRATNALGINDYVFGKIYMEKASSTTYFLNIWLFDNDISAADFKSYLAAQYAAGTPVTVWYVLANPTTDIVNEPIRKIGDYVDSVSGTNLATSGTEQELDVDTTLKPSEFDLTYHGWHEHEDTKYST